MDSVRRGLGRVLLVQGAVLAVLALPGAAQPLGAAAGGAYGLLCDLLIVRGLTARGFRRLGTANGITWVRCAVVGGVVALVVAPAGPQSTGCLVVAAVVALLLDGVDGRVARRTGTTSPFGSRFDMEVDASLVLALSIAATPRVGSWVLLIGAARYLLLVATVLVPSLDRPTPPRLWRKVVAVGQGVALTAVCARVLAQPVDEAIAVVAAVALGWSFATQVQGLLTGASHVLPVAAPEPVDARRD